MTVSLICLVSFWLSSPCLTFHLLFSAEWLNGRPLTTTLMNWRTCCSLMLSAEVLQWTVCSLIVLSVDWFALWHMWDQVVQSFASAIQSKNKPFEVFLSEKKNRVCNTANWAVRQPVMISFPFMFTHQTCRYILFPLLFCLRTSAPLSCSQILSQDYGLEMCNLKTMATATFKNTDNNIVAYIAFFIDICVNKRSAVYPC